MSNPLWPDDWEFLKGNSIDDKLEWRRLMKESEEKRRQEEIAETLLKREEDKVIVTLSEAIDAMAKGYGATVGKQAWDNLTPGEAFKKNKDKYESTPGGTGRSWDKYFHYTSLGGWADYKDVDLGSAKKAYERFQEAYGGNWCDYNSFNPDPKNHAGDGKGCIMQGKCPACGKTVSLEVMPGRVVRPEQVHYWARVLLSRHCDGNIFNEKVVSEEWVEDPKPIYGSWGVMQRKVKRYVLKE